VTDAAVAPHPLAESAPLRRRSSAGAPATDRLAVFFLLAPLVATTFLAKWAVPFGPRDLGMSWPLILVAVLVGWMTGRLRIDPVRCAALFLLIGFLGAVQVLRGDVFSLPSLLLMAAIFGCYVMSIGAAPPSRHDALRLFLTVSAVIAAASVAQFGLQFVVGRDLAFPVDNLLPRALLIEGYNNQIPIADGTRIQKANGVFLLEPSFLSQLMAVAIVAELSQQGGPWTLPRLARLGGFAAALLLSYSGTGLLVLAVGLPVLIIVQRRWMLMLLGLLLLGLAVTFQEQLRLDIYLERAGEFTSVRSSGFERFVSPFLMFEEFLWRDPWRSLFGIGAGSYPWHERIAFYPAAEMAYSKIIFEFGVLGAIATFAFLLWVVLTSRAPLALRVTVVVMFFMSGLYTAASHGMALTLLAWPPRDPPDRQDP
jgi:hypothetical protein